MLREPFRSQLVRMGLALLAVLTTVGAVAPSWSSSSEGRERRNRLQGFADDFADGWYYPIHRSCRLVHSLTEHSIERRIAPRENWLQWVAGQFYPPLQRTQRVDRILERGIGDCSERVIVLQTLVRKQLLPTRIVGLGGHVVLEVQANRKWYTADPDYGVVFPWSVERMSELPDRAIAWILAEAGYSLPQIAEYLRIVKSTEDNIAMPLNTPLSPRLAWLETICHHGIIVLPAAMWSLLGILAMTRSRRS
jgi:hypothetical protein